MPRTDKGGCREPWGREKNKISFGIQVGNSSMGEGTLRLRNARDVNSNLYLLLS